MKLSLVGAIDGNITEFYKQLNNGPSPQWVICTGNFGVWPDTARIDRATKIKSGTQEFAKLYVDGWGAPVPTLFVSGTHEDHNWLQQRFRSKNTEVLNNVHWLANGFKTVVGDIDNNVRITGLGKVYSASTYSGKQHKRSYRHYTRHEVERACSSGPTDLLVFHETPNTPGLKNIIYATRPKVIIHSALKFKQYSIQNIPVIALPKGYTRYVEFKEGKFLL